MIMISSSSKVYKIVGHGRPAVKRRSSRRRGVVMTLDVQQLADSCPKNSTGASPIDISHIEYFAELA